MKITLENTDTIVTLVTPKGDTPARVWVGQTDSGIGVTVLITRIAANKDEDLAQFDAELKETRAPEPIEMAFPLRMVL